MQQTLALEKNGKRLGHHLKAIVTSIVPLAQRVNKPGQLEALSVLSLLMKQTQIKDAILHLDPFPDSPVFAEINRIYYRYHWASSFDVFGSFTHVWLLLVCEASTAWPEKSSASFARGRELGRARWRTRSPRHPPSPLRRRSLPWRTSRGCSRRPRRISLVY